MDFFFCSDICEIGETNSIMNNDYCEKKWKLNGFVFLIHNNDAAETPSGQSLSCFNANQIAMVTRSCCLLYCINM